MDNSPVAVKRVHHSPTGTHIEPPLNPKWSELEKLRYLAAVVALDVGAEIGVEVSSIAKLFTASTYTVLWPSGASGPKSFEQTWCFITGMRAGVNARRYRFREAT